MCVRFRDIHTKFIFKVFIETHLPADTTREILDNEPIFRPQGWPVSGRGSRITFGPSIAIFSGHYEHCFS